MTFSSQQHQYQTQNSINASATPTTPSTPTTMPGLAPINVYQPNHPTPKLHLLHLKSTPDGEITNDMLGGNILKRSVSAKEDTGGLTAEMQEFIREFKTRRVNLGYTQDDVGRELSALNGPTYSQSLISRFEGKQLRMKAAERMRPILEAWIQSKEEDASSCNNKFQKKRRKRTSFPPEYVQILNEYFQKNQKPTLEEMQEIADKINLDTTTVKVWFCNKKQSLKRQGQPVFNRNPMKVEVDGAKRKRKGDSSEMFSLTQHAGMKTLTPTGQITVPFFISQDGNAIPIVSASAVANSSVQSTSQTSGHPLNTTMHQQIVHLSQVPLLTSMAVVNNGANDPAQTQIIQGGRILSSGSVLQIPGGPIPGQQHIQQTHGNMNDTTVIIAPSAENGISAGTSSLPGGNSTLSPQQQQNNRNRDASQNDRILLNKSSLNNELTEKDLESDEVCVADEPSKSDKLMPRSINNDTSENGDKKL